MPLSCRYLFHTHTNDTQLVALSALARTNPAAFSTALRKYDDAPERRRLPRPWVPLLNCRWADVVFLSPVHPIRI
jgi:hypothetical protein